MESSLGNIRIDGDRLWRTLMDSAKIGPGRAGGLRRLALDDADKEMRDLFVAWCEAAGCAISVDGMGNIFARRAGSDDTLPPVMIGSHLDTQVAGGRYDGILGVLGGLEVVRTLNDHGIATKRPIEVVNWTNEEGARFRPPMIASAVFAGVRELDWALARTDDDGYVYGGGADPHRLRRHDADGWARHRQLFRAAYRARPRAGGQEPAARHRHRRLSGDRHERRLPRRDCAFRADRDGAPAQRAGRRRHAHRQGQRGRLEIRRHRRQGDREPHRLLAQPARHPARLRPGDDRLPHAGQGEDRGDGCRGRSRDGRYRRARPGRGRGGRALGVRQRGLRRRLHRPDQAGGRRPRLGCQWRSKKGPPWRCKKGPLGGCGLVP